MGNKHVFEKAFRQIGKGPSTLNPEGDLGGPFEESLCDLECCGVLCCVVLCCVVLCCVALFYVMLWYGMLCYVVYTEFHVRGTGREPPMECRV